ncbi:hypothetical protein SAMN02745857_01121 [Andreprevotia lacus DSM 23236]|jgi:hypothetical protein|uniref:DUF1993 domain-containing protein n=1 Tax=Andreprevotia lacus DSM 23236 TaxID=1121001 RepID=A0A1W1XBF2_9NEIS|nr:DUF1993 domain-containing protein [Andreprevotia lacus]SMC21104.1 hypothetical protein SAMN02745857_01121 [Andreprevotia lacus DSM 23236]
MSLSHHQIALPTYIRMLGNLSAFIDKALEFCSAGKIDETVLLQTRLYPNMLPLVKQFQIATDQAKGSIARLSGIAAPKFADDETTFAQLKARIATTLDYLNGIPADALGEVKGKEVVLPWMQDHPLEGEFYLLHFAIPNVYFHVSTTYAILRHVGVPLGKNDFIGEL